MRLHQSIVRYKNRPVLVLAATEASTNLCARPLDNIDDDKAAFIINANDEDLDISSVPLGYVNTENDAVFVSRVPVRRQKQGVSTDNTVVNYHGVGNAHNDGLFGFHLKYLIATIEGHYPSVEDALAEVLKDKRGRAFHRYFAFGKQDRYILLHQEGQAIGIRLRDADRPTVRLFPGWAGNRYVESILGNLGIFCTD